MRPETFFEKFELFADAPNAVGKMRELVLELAMQGNLVPQGSADWMSDTEPVEPTTAGDEDSLPFNIPGLWAWIELSKVARFINGDRSKNYPSKSFRVESGVPFINAGHLSNGDVSLDDMDYITEEHFSLLGGGKVKRGDVLYCLRGSLGKSAVVSGVERGAIASSLLILRPTERVLAKYLYFYLISPLGRLMISRYDNGSAQPNLSAANLKKYLLPLPPLAEQKRIVAKVDELMALCDRLEAQQKERDTRHTALARASLARFAEAPTPANLDFLFHKSYPITPADLRKAILSLAVQGLLVPYDAQSAEWKTRALKELTAKIGSGSTPFGGKASYQESGVPLIRSMNVHFGGFVRDGLAFLNEEQAEKLKNVSVKADDVLLNITGASIGRVATAPKNMEGARVNQHVCIIRPTAEVLPKFLKLFLASPVVQHLIDDVQVGATREALTKAMIEQFEIPVPPLAEQRRIVAKVDQLMALVDRLETQLAASRTASEVLMEAAVSELTVLG